MTHDLTDLRAMNQADHAKQERDEVRAVQPSGTYNHLLHHQMPHVLAALKIAQRLAKETGTDDDIARINYAIRMINLCEVMYDDKCVEGMNATADECNRYGSD